MKQYIIILVFVGLISWSQMSDDTLRYGIFKTKTRIYDKINPVNISNGCCYNVGYGTHMIPYFTHYHVKSYNECTPEERLGGARRYYNGTCHELKKIHRIAYSNEIFI